MKVSELEQLTGPSVEVAIEGTRLSVETEAGEATGVWDRIETGDVLDCERALARLLLIHEDVGASFVFLRAPKISAEVEKALASFMRKHAAGTGWGFLDDYANGCLRIPELHLDRRMRSVTVEAGTANMEFATHAASVSTSHAAVANQNLFTDLNQWLLKVMILSRAPVKFWPAARHVEIENPRSLADVAWIDVSQAKVYQFAHTLKEAGHLVWRRGEFRLVDVPELLHRWLSVARNERPRRTPVRSPFGDSAREIFRGTGREIAYAYAGPLAAELYGLRHIPEQLEEVYVFSPFQDLFEEKMLEPCEPSRADFYILRPLHRNSVERGVQALDDGEERAVDVVQAALDSVRRPARGEEQAEYLVNEIASWFGS